MPLITSIIRDGETLPIKWGSFHVAAMIVAAAIDSGRGPWENNSRDGIITSMPKASCGHPANEDGACECSWWPEKAPHMEADVIPLAPSDYCGLLVSYPVIGMTPLNDGEYMLKETYRFVDVADGEFFELKAGDILNAYRGY